MRALDMRLSAKTQETDTYCGPAAVQTVLATMGVSAPSQSTLADAAPTLHRHPRLRRLAAP
ncbi:hypothetical protein [Nonomuraea dietziae]|uniref:hypothetical protein n=1 Tax=Nonomuraea dietziae TaxID=65515 RepID=UPI0033F6558E